MCDRCRLAGEERTADSGNPGDSHQGADAVVVVTVTRFDRQSFLGAGSAAVHSRARVGIVGGGGGGSHAAQQLAHVGIGEFVLIDPQTIEESNLNRLVGATQRDVDARTPKVVIAKWLINGIAPDARVEAFEAGWSDCMPSLRSCDIIIGAVDSLSTRDELEQFCRANLIPYIDMGMTVTAVDAEFLISGQVIRSMPGFLCMRCLNFITPQKLSVEAKKYGEAGDNPQVVWSNGQFASAAVGLVVDLLTPWCRMPPLVYLTYDGNRGILKPSPLAEGLEGLECPHHPSSEIGDPAFSLGSTSGRRARPDSIEGD